MSIQDGCTDFAAIVDAFNVMADAHERQKRELSMTREKADYSAARITTIYEGIPNSGIIVNRDRQITYLNERARAELFNDRNLVGMKFEQACFEMADGEFANRVLIASAGTSSSVLAEAQDNYAQSDTVVVRVDGHGTMNNCQAYQTPHVGLPTTRSKVVQSIAFDSIALNEL